MPALLAVSLFVGGSFPVRADGQEPPKQSATIDVIGVTPIDGIGLDRAKFPTNAQRIVVENGRDAAESLAGGVPAVERNDPQGAPLQSDLQFRGFSVSPLLGAPEGLALYQDGVRLNEPFGDTIAWATIPSNAIETIEVIPGANPTFGLNALGGALAMRTRSNSETTSAVLRGASFGQVNAEFATGGERWFASASHLRDGGWRDFSPSVLTQLFASRRWSSGDLRLTLGRSFLTGNGPAPEALLATDRAAVFTHPDETRSDMAMITTHQQQALHDALFLEGTGYIRHTRTRTFNGDDSPYEACADSEAPGLLCLGDEIVRDISGASVAIPAGTELDATNNRTSLRQTAFGSGVQIDRSGTIARRMNRFIAGASVDGGFAHFRSSTELAELTEDRSTNGRDIIVGDSLVDLTTRTTTISGFVANIFTATSRLTVTSTARLNHVRMRLDDRIGTALDGKHSFTQLHPSLGAAYEIARGVNVFANIGLTGRTPTPVELSCADPEDPCRLPNAFVSDPPLRAVTSNTFEIGVRGSGAATSWSLAAHRSVSNDDLVFISSGPLRGEGHFANVGTTRRQGLEFAADGRIGARLGWSAAYALLDAVFVTPFDVAAPNHPVATDGEINVEGGDRLPLAPRHMAKLSAMAQLTPRITAGASARFVSDQFFRGDEANLAEPLPSYTVADARLDLRITTWASIAIEVRNVLDSEYATFGVFGDADDVLGEEYEDSRRFVTPSPPRTFSIAVTTRF